VYTWYPGTYLSDSSIKDPIAYVPKTSKWYVTTQGRNNCVVSDSVMIYVPENNFGLAPRDTIVCYGESLRLPTTGGGKTFQWFQNGFEPAQNLSCTDCATPIVTALETTTYTVIVKDSVNCADTFFSTIRVRPLPDVRILQGDTTIKFGQSVVLRVTGAESYYWTPAASLSAAIGTTVIAAPRETTKYVVSGIADSGPSVGCRSLDSVTITVDPSDHLFVPSAFSPNGDGANDVFRVSNLTFQRLMEFRVYNRFGQEIFSTTDPKKGWDGTWKGVRQDMGVYQYMIRVAFPDGVVEKYQGDVTLLR
jgi:gliding motility-associated-like protein